MNSGADGELPEEDCPRAAEKVDNALCLESGGAQVVPDLSVQEVARRLPHEESLEYDATHINNRPNGKNTERPVFDVGGLRDQDALSLADVAQYTQQDREEFEQVATQMTEVLGVHISTDKAVEMVSRRMTDLMLSAVRAIASHEKQYIDEIWKRIHVRDGKPVNPNALSFRMFGDPASLQEVDGQYYTYSGWLYKWMHREQIARLDAEVKDLKRKMDQDPIAFHSGRTYEVHPTTELRTQTHSARDVVLIYEDGDQRRLLRLNLIQRELAQRGIFYKGGPKDNSFKRTNTRGDQAAYPTSPLQFFQDHVLPALLEGEPPKIHNDEKRENHREW